MKDSTAYMVTDILRDVLTDGTGKRAAIQVLILLGKRVQRILQIKMVQKIHGLLVTQQIIQLQHGADIKIVLQ